MLPVLYDRWLQKSFVAGFPQEPHATCSDCAMCKGDVAAAFRPDVKCCTYLPRLPNFAVGAILSDSTSDGEAGRQSTLQRINADRGVLPLGVMSTATYSTIYELGSSQAFGKSLELLCPHYVSSNGTCGIWRYRNSVCSTYYCKHDRGALGKRFWDSLKALLAVVEDEVPIWCAVELGMPGEAIARAIEIRNRRSHEDIGSELAGVRGVGAEVWADWDKRRLEFYEASYRLVEKLAWEDVVRICGPSLQVRVLAIKDAYSALGTHRLPQHPVLGRVQFENASAEQARIVSYSAMNPLIVSKGIVYLLQYFDGRPLDEILTAIRRDEGVDVEATLLQRLSDFEVLVEAGPVEKGQISI